MSKLCKYVIIKDGVLCVLETDRMKEVIRNELGVFDYRDYIFDDDPSVGSLTVVSNFSLTKSLKTLIISMLLSFFIVKFAKINVLIWANACYNRHRR